MKKRNKPSGSVPYANGHDQSPRNDSHTIKSDAVYPMEMSLVDMDALVVLSLQRAYVRTSLLHVPHSERRVPEAAYNYCCERAVVQNAGGGCELEDL